MLLNGEELKKRELIQNADSSRFRAATYDLRIGQIFPPFEGDSKATRYITNHEGNASDGYYLQPQGMVRVVSQERVKLPKNIAGYALVKNRLCNAGVLAINIGVIDPLYDGPISSTLINFGNNPYCLSPGTEFLRLSFHEFAPDDIERESLSISDADYRERTRQEVILHSSPTFLNLDATSSAASEKAFGKFKRWLVVWAAVFAVILTVLTVLVPVGVAYADRYLVPGVKWKGELVGDIQNEVRSQCETRVRELERRLSSLESRPERGKVSTVEQRASPDRSQVNVR